MLKIGGLEITRLLSAALRSTTTVSPTLDTREYVQDLAVLFDSEATNAPGVVLVGSIQTADDAAFTVNLSTVHSFQVVLNTAGNNQTAILKADSMRRFMRVNAGVSGTTPSVAFTAIAIGTKKAR